MAELNPAQRFALGCVGSDSDSETDGFLRRFFKQYREIDWNNLFDYGDKLLPFISTVIHKHVHLIPVPQRMISLFRLQHLSTLQKNHGTLKVIAETARGFNAGGIRLIFIKGAALLTTVYRDDPGLRKMEDIDALLADRNDLPGAEILLKQMGFEGISGTTYQGLTYDPEAWWKEHHLHLIYFKGLQRFELHWKTDFESGELFRDKLIESSREINADGSILRIPGPEGALLIACTNFIKDFREYNATLAGLRPEECESRTFYYRLFFLYEIKKIARHYRKNISWGNLTALINASKQEYEISSLLLLAKKIVRADITVSFITGIKRGKPIWGFLFWQRWLRCDQFQKLFKIKEKISFFYRACYGYADKYVWRVLRRMSFL